jgi:hypothetical protein
MPWQRFMNSTLSLLDIIFGNDEPWERMWWSFFFRELHGLHTYAVTKPVASRRFTVISPIGSML